VTDREEAGLRGQVKICSGEHDIVYPDHHWVSHTVDTYSAQGQLLEKRHRNPDGSSWSILWRHDEHGKLLEKKHVSDKPGQNQVFSYRYDPQDRLERVVLNPGQEGERLFESVQYAADGTKMRTSYPAVLADAERKNISVSVESMLHLSIDAVAIMTVLDASDRPVRRVLYDADDRVIRRVVFRYDARGLLVEEGEWIGGAIRDDFRNVYRYDASGRQIEVDKRWGGFGGGRRSFTYNAQGDIVQEVIEQSTGVMSENDGSQAWTERFTYKYDAQDNWIERTMETIPETGEARLISVDRRELTYYA